MIERRRTDVLVLGAGGAGLLAALHAKDAAPDLDVREVVRMLDLSGVQNQSAMVRVVRETYRDGLGLR